MGAFCSCGSFFCASPHQKEEDDCLYAHTYTTSSDVSVLHRLQTLQSTRPPEITLSMGQLWSSDKDSLDTDGLWLKVPEQSDHGAEGINYFLSKGMEEEEE